MSSNGTQPNGEHWLYGSLAGVAHELQEVASDMHTGPSPLLASSPPSVVTGPSLVELSSPPPLLLLPLLDPPLLLPLSLLEPLLEPLLPPVPASGVGLFVLSLLHAATATQATMPIAASAREV